MTRPAIRTYFPFALALSVLLLFLPNRVAAQQGLPDSFIATTPFASWLGTARKPEIQWHVEVLPAELTYYQRIDLGLLVKVPGREVLHHVPAGGLAFLFQVSDAKGRVFQDHTLLEPQLVEKGVTKGDLEISEHMLVNPGNYSVALALYDQKTKQHSFDQREVNVRALKNDPLPNSWPVDVGVQFFDPQDSVFKLFLDENRAYLNLPVHNSRPVHLDVILNFVPSRNTSRSVTHYNQEQLVYFNALAAFTGLDLEQGSVSVEIADPDLHRVLFEQSDARKLDWRRLATAVQTLDPARVDVNALQHRGDDQRFLADAIQARLDRAVGAQRDQPRPLNVFVVISNPTDFGPQNAPSQLSFAPGADSAVFYISATVPTVRPERPDGMRPPSFSRPIMVRPEVELGDDIALLLAPLKPKTFEVTSPEEMRTALASLISELAKY